MAHRLSYETFVGPIPDGKELDHVCGVRRCVNPSHLEPVTHHENVLRGKRLLRGVCRKGHTIDEANTRNVRTLVKGKLYHSAICRICDNAYRLAKQREKRRAT